MIELVVERCSPEGAFTVEHRQRAEAVGFVDVSSIAVDRTFGIQAFALPQELGGDAIDGFVDTSAEGIVLVGCDAAAGQADTDQAMLAVVTVFGNEFLPGAGTLADQVAISDSPIHV